MILCCVHQRRISLRISTPLRVQSSQRFVRAAIQVQVHAYAIGQRKCSNIAIRVSSSSCLQIILFYSLLRRHIPACESAVREPTRRENADAHYHPVQMGVKAQLGFVRLQAVRFVLTCFLVFVEAFMIDWPLSLCVLASCARHRFRFGFSVSSVCWLWWSY